METIFLVISFIEDIVILLLNHSSGLSVASDSANQEITIFSNSENAWEGNSEIIGLDLILIFFLVLWRKFLTFFVFKSVSDVRWPLTRKYQEMQK